MFAKIISVYTNIDMEIKITIMFMLELHAIMYIIGLGISGVVYIMYAIHYVRFQSQLCSQIMFSVIKSPIQ